MKHSLVIFLLVAVLFAQCKKDSQFIETPNAEDLHFGSLLYAKENCSNCHGIDWNGQGPEAAALKEKGLVPANFAALENPDTTPVDYFKTITRGSEKMPEHSYQYITDRGRWALAHFLFTMAPQLKGAQADQRLGALSADFTEAREAYARAETRGRRRWEMGYKPYGEREPKPGLDELIQSTGTTMEAPRDESAQAVEPGVEEKKPEAPAGR